jgi:antitoxin MazE
METMVGKWGNSLAVRIPKTFGQELGLGDGTPVRMTVADGTLVLTPVTARVYDLSKLLRAVSPSNLQREVDTGPPQGREGW